MNVPTGKGKTMLMNMFQGVKKLLSMFISIVIHGKELVALKSLLTRNKEAVGKSTKWIWVLQFKPISEIMIVVVQWHNGQDGNTRKPKA